MHPFMGIVAKTIKDNNLLQAGDTVIVAVSGGADSVALLDVLHSFCELRLHLVVAHLNHRLRGEDSDGDADFVAQLAEKYGLPLELRAVDVNKLSRDLKLSLEEAGREARYSWFNELAAKHGARAVALGHHADDQAETVLMRLLRGAGTSGLCGMSPISAGDIIRPLLGATRTEIEDYLDERKIPFRTDGSNSDTQFLRNRIRHELLPLLKSYNPSISERLVATADILNADEELLESVTARAFQRLTRSDSTGVHIDIPKLRPELQGLRLRIYRKAVHTAKGSLAHITAKHLQQIDDLVFSDKANAKVTLPGNLVITRSYQTLSLTVQAEQGRMVPLELVIGGPGTYSLPGNKYLSITLSPPPVDWQKLLPTKAYFDLDKAPFPWLIRTFRNGDRFTPIGMAGTKKLKDFFIDTKTPRDNRRHIPLIFSAGVILWIVGLRVAAQALITNATRRVAAVEILEYEP